MKREKGLFGMEIDAEAGTVRLRAPTYGLNGFDETLCLDDPQYGELRRMAAVFGIKSRVNNTSAKSAGPTGKVDQHARMVAAVEDFLHLKSGGAWLKGHRGGGGVGGLLTMDTRLLLRALRLGCPDDSNEKIAVTVHGWDANTRKAVLLAPEMAEYVEQARREMAAPASIAASALAGLGLRKPADKPTDDEPTDDEPTDEPTDNEPTDEQP
jgi:hypothetical protein